MPIEVMDCREKTRAEQEEAIRGQEDNARQRGFGFGEAPLMRVLLMRLEDQRYRMLWSHHHILIDGWSIQLMMEEFLRCYESLAEGKEWVVGSEERYEDYIRYIERRDRQKEETFWREYMQGVTGSTLLPFIGATPERTKGIGVFAEELLVIGNELTARVEQYVQSRRLTVNTLMQGVWSYLLHRYTGQNEISYGVVGSGRPEELPDIEGRIGMYINTLPLRSQLDEDEEIAAWLQALQEGQVASRQYQYTPLRDIQGWAGVTEDLFDTILVFENYPVSEVIASKPWKLRVERVSVNELTNYPLSIMIIAAEQMRILFWYNTQLLTREQVQRIAGHFERVLLQVIGEEAGRVGELRLLTELEEHQLLEAFNATAVEYPADKTVIGLFEGQVERSPEATAVIYGQETMSYRALNERANQLGHYLRGLGVREEMPVALLLDRSPAMLIGILGILKAGGAYVPIDPAYPEARIRYLVEDSGAAVVLTREIMEGPDWRSEPATDPTKDTGPDQLAYIIYTSGSTGKPKGVMVEQRSLVNYLCNSRDRYCEAGSTGAVRFVHLAASFDAARTALLV